jgi:beta-lactamase class A
LDAEGTLTLSIALPVAADPQMTQTVVDALVEAGLRDIGYSYVLDLQTMRYGDWRAHEDIYPASVIKVAIMAEAFRQYEQGIVRPGDRITISESNQTTTWGVSPFAPGVVATVADLVDRMITHSDNVATNQLMDVLRRERVTAYMRQLRLETFLLGRKLSGSEPLIEDSETVGRNRLPPAEVGRLLALIATDVVPGAAQQREIMRRCVHADKLAPGVRAGDDLMHKTGETSDLSHDAGILRTPQGKAYVVVLYTTPDPKPDDSDADHVNPQMAHWMRSLRTAL